MSALLFFSNFCVHLLLLIVGSRPVSVIIPRFSAQKLSHPFPVGFFRPLHAVCPVIWPENEIMSLAFVENRCTRISVICLFVN